MKKLLNKKTVLGITSSLFWGLMTASVNATDFAWVEDAAKFERGALRVSVGAAFYDEAYFPFSNSIGELYEAPWVGARFSASENAQFYFAGALRKTLNNKIISRTTSPTLKRETLSATGDFSIYSKLRFPLFGERLDFGIVTGFTMPNTNTESGLGLDRNVIHGRLIVGYSAGDFRLIGNTGIAIVDNTTGDGQDDFFTYGFAVVAQAHRNVELHGELYGIDGPEDGASDGLFDSLNVAAGIGVSYKGVTTDVTGKLFFKDESPSSGVFVRFSRTFHLGRNQDKK